MWYWSANTLFWQLSVDHNMDITVATLVWTDGRMYGHLTTKIDYQTFLALRLLSRTHGALL